MDNALIESLVSGALSSGFTTVIYQPLELLKTRIQLEKKSSSSPYIGRLFKSTKQVLHDHNIAYLWRGTGASLLRSVPGIGLYYASLNVLQTNLSEYGHKPDSPTQAFCFGLTARSIISFVLLPITVVKVRYESGQYRYSNLPSAVKDAYLRTGWIGATPTVLRDSLFSGIYYMCYTKLKATRYDENQSHSKVSDPMSNFLFGIVSGLVASIITNPIDVLKTTIQVDRSGNKSMKKAVMILLDGERGCLRLFDGLVPRSLRRTLVATTTWTFYELFMDSMRTTSH